MPFREATALVSIEREGVIETRVQTLQGRSQAGHVWKTLRCFMVHRLEHEGIHPGMDRSFLGGWRKVTTRNLTC